MVKTCKNCKYWGREFEDFDDDIENGRFPPTKILCPTDYSKNAFYNKQHKQCGRVPMIDDVVGWHKDFDGLVLNRPELKAFAHDGSSYMAFLTTLEDFYCNQWDRKDD